MENNENEIFKAFCEHWIVRVLVIGALCAVIAKIMNAMHICMIETWTTAVIWALIMAFLISGARALYRFSGERWGVAVILSILTGIVCIVVSLWAALTGYFSSDLDYVAVIDGKKYAAYDRTWHHIKVSIYEYKGPIFRGTEELYEVNDLCCTCNETESYLKIKVPGSEEHVHIKYEKDYEAHKMVITSIQ